MPLKSSGLQVYTGNAWASAVAAIIASYERAAVLRPDCRSDAATRRFCERSSLNFAGQTTRFTGVKREGIEIRFGLLQMRLTCNTFVS